ncbi:phosphopentomutase [Rhizobium sp. RU20A]|uniref:phosphopentomutase n=1 Tax=Rhizobium sp. RU20A TaxID=1907412 RepID=UPI0009568DB2|nr:phosphopentomutase [Rhizobium sp. RU20A]SIQ77757.1 phosphopentomutase [Rhizobium sp. RU20A]
MARAFLLLLDSFGIGGARDAAAYGDDGANTLGHIAEYCAAGAADREGLREGPLKLPMLSALGLLEAARVSTGRYPVGMSVPDRTFAIHAAASEVSRGKDTPSGHWEIAGVPVLFDWGHFPTEGDAFPPELVAALCREGNVGGILGNCHASGTEIIARLGEEHLRTGFPICYTSADSVFQVAAHEGSFGIDRLNDFCLTARRLLDAFNIGRVIARPFLGHDAQSFRRTANRRDFSVPPPAPTLLDRLKSAGRQVHGIGKVSDIFAHQGVTDITKADGNAALFEATISAIDSAPEGSLTFVNLVDFDMLYGHRRDVAGYAAALEAFDRRLPTFGRKLKLGDLAIITADHGCDPTWRGTDHTRERVPVLAFGPGFGARSAGILPTFADVGETIAKHLGLPPGENGRSFL